MVAVLYKSPFFKRGLSEEFRSVPPFGKGGVGGFRFMEHLPYRKKLLANAI
jgi:hypothetical protein